MSDALDIFNEDPEIPAAWRDMIDSSPPNAALADDTVALVRKEVGELSEFEALRLWAVVAHSPVEPSSDTAALLDYAWLTAAPGEPARLRWGGPDEQLWALMENPHAEHVAYFRTLAAARLSAAHLRTEAR